ncbi:MAG: hypothetical protein PUC65_01500 [Clostridiales bacterium]|nr:hypothetical protein [Clostridiales bacterium]
MKNYKTPTMESLDVKFTENGTALFTQVDEIRVDNKGNYWVSFSGEGKPQNVDGKMPN